MHDTASLAGLSFAETYGGNNKLVIDIGGININGSLKKYFEERGMIYFAIDIEEHPSVDIVVKPGDKLPFETGSVDLIVSTSCFEHDPCFWITFREMTRVLKLDGYIYVNAPSAGKYHCHPGDNWRFYFDAGQALAYWSGYKMSNEEVYPVRVVETFNILPLNRLSLNDNWIDFVCVWERVHEKETNITISNDIINNIGILEQSIQFKGLKTSKKHSHNQINNLIDALIIRETNVINHINNKIVNIHKHLKINYGSFNEELPEQKMVVRYLRGNEKVLEIGSNIGRNSLVIAYILGNNMNNFVTLETDEEICYQLNENRDLNNMSFHIENYALSKRNLIQKGWDTIVSDVILDGYKKVNTITYDNFKMKYNINFDTLVLDCEGAFYYILQDMPEILDNIKLIIMENDYKDITHKQYIDNILIKNNFYVDYREAGGWGPCYNCFFEVWKK